MQTVKSMATIKSRLGRLRELISMIKIELKEHETALKEILLSSSQAWAISQFKYTEVSSAGKVLRSPIVTVSPGQGEGSYRLRARNIVGSFAVAGVAITIHPKVGDVSALRMLSYSLRSAHFQVDETYFRDSSTAMPEILTSMFLKAVEEVCRTGLIESYVEVCETGTKIRGSIDFSGQAGRPLPLPVDYAYDEFSIDNWQNQLLLRALHAVRDLGGQSKLVDREMARSLISGFGDVSYVDVPTLYEGDFIDERMAHYVPSMVLATLILRSVGLDLGGSDRSGRGLLFNMNRVFEDYVCEIIRRSVPNRFVDYQGARRVRSFAKKQKGWVKNLPLRPDFSVWDGASCLLIGDVKYKVLEEGSFPERDDLYQMYSYLRGLGSKYGVLLYVGDFDEFVIPLAFDDVEIFVIGIDVALDVDYLARKLAKSIQILTNGIFVLEEGQAASLAG